jgi:SAM-dependent methyltransferase
MTGDYHASRLTHDARRTELWNALWRYHFNRMIGPRDCVIDLGCGYGEFINAVRAGRRIALDAWPGFTAYLDEGVEGVVGPVTELDFLDNASVDFAFASNLFEHITQAELITVLAALRTRLSPRGTLTILQPNWQYAFREYFDDYTHITVYSHISLADLLTAQDWEVLDVRPRFLPLTIKSRLPVWPFLIHAYLLSPIKPMGKQMLITARPRR